MIFANWQEDTMLFRLTLKLVTSDYTSQSFAWVSWNRVRCTVAHYCQYGWTDVSVWLDLFSNRQLTVMWIQLETTYTKRVHPQLEYKINAFGRPLTLLRFAQLWQPKASPHSNRSILKWIFGYFPSIPFLKRIIGFMDVKCLC